MAWASLISHDWFRNVYKLTWLRMVYGWDICALLSGNRTLSQNIGVFGEIFEDYIQLPADVLQLKTPTLAGCRKLC